MKLITRRLVIFQGEKFNFDKADVICYNMELLKGWIIMTNLNKKKYFAKKREIMEFIFSNHERYGDERTACLATLFQFDFIFDEALGLSHEAMEILSKFDIFYDDTDVYKKFYSFLKERNFLRGNVLEVGAGVYPRLCEVIMDEKPPELINVTAYDPALILDTLPGVTLKKEKFTVNTNIDSVDTLYGLFPCKASIPLIDKALDEDKNLLIAFCGCDHSDSEHMKWFGKTWAEDVVDDYREIHGKKLEVFTWDKKLGLDLPIMAYKSQAKQKK